MNVEPTPPGTDAAHGSAGECAGATPPGAYAARRPAAHALAAEDVRAAVDRVLDHPGTELLAPGDGRPIRTIALVLDPGDVPGGGPDLVLVHRSHGAQAPDGVALLGCHDPLDHALGLDAPLAAAALGLTGHRVLEERLALVDGPPAAVRARLLDATGGADQEHAPPRADRPFVAMASALRPALVHRATAAGAGLYVTGQWRPAAADAVAETGIGVLALGHRRSELWALEVLAAALRDAFGGLAVEVVGART